MDSEMYVRLKKKACEEVGIDYFGFELKETASMEEVLESLRQLNEDPKISGILV